MSRTWNAHDLHHWEFWALHIAFVVGLIAVTSQAEPRPYAAVIGAYLFGYYFRRIETWAKEEIDAKADRRDLLKEEWGGSHE